MSSKRLRALAVLAVIAIIFLLGELVLFLVGGARVSNMKVLSVFSLGRIKDVRYNLSSQKRFLYDQGPVVFMKDGIQLKESETAVLGANDGDTEGEEVSSVVTTYPTERPAVTIKDGIDFREVKKITERSSINDDQSSDDEPRDFKENSDTNITYQLSPDGRNWYYFNENESRWSKTTQGWESSNAVQVVNKHLDTYSKDFGNGKLYVKTFLHSNGNKNVTLKEVVVEREVGPLIRVNEKLPEEPKQEEVVIDSLDFNVVQVEIFNAAYFGGNKVVKGKVLLKDKKVKAVYKVTQQELDRNEAKVYLSDAAGVKGNLLGATNLYINDRGEIEFLLITPSVSGGYVTAEVVLKEKPEINSPEAKPLLSSVLGNSTFTVDSTGDGADVVTDGLCADSGGACTLRAAIAEVNGAAGPHTIAFNISTSDAGYRDYDTEGTSSSGDSVGGDDFWTIIPGSVLPNIASTGVTIDGATQTTNQGNFNTSGPEIQINGTTVGENRGLYFTGTNGVVNSIIVNRFGSAAAAIEVTGDGFSITNSYVGPFAKGLAGETGANRSGFGIYFNVASGTVGTSTSNGNVISGNNTYGINISCGTGGLGERVNISGNYFGLGADGTTSLINGTANAFMLNDCQSLVGGDTVANRNYFAGSTSGILHQLSASNVVMFEVYNNFFGTDVTGMLSRPHTGAGLVNNAASGVNITLVTYKVGAQGKGNLFRYSVRGIQFITGGRREMEIAYNTFSDHTNYGMYFLNNTRVLPLTKIHHNYLGAFSPDPYFGLTTGANTTGGAQVGNLQGIEYYNNVTSGGLAGDVYSSANGSSFHDNEIYGMTGTGVTLAGASSNFYNNLIHDNGDTGVAMNQSNQGPRLFTNNTIYNNAKNIRFGNDFNWSVKVRENIFYNASLQSYTIGGKENGDGSPVEMDDPGDPDYWFSPTFHQLMNRPEIRSIIYLGAGRYRLSGVVDGKISQAPFEIEICESEDHVSGFGGCVDSLGVTTTASTPDSVSGASNYYNWTIDVQTQYGSENENILFGGLTVNAVWDTSDISQTVGVDGTRSNNGFIPTYSVLEEEVEPTPSATPTEAPTGGGVSTPVPEGYNLTLIYPKEGVSVDDQTPFFDWNILLKNDIADTQVKHYKVFVDEVEIGQTTSDVTELITPDSKKLSNKEHKWYVVAYKSDNTELVRSNTQTFKVVSPRYAFSLVYPVGVTIDTSYPIFNWTSIKSGSNAAHYDLYLDEKYLSTIKVNVNEGVMEYGLPKEKGLKDADHSWQVIAYFRNEDGKSIEVGRTNTATFKVDTTKLAAFPGVGGEEKEDIPNPLLTTIGAILLTLVLLAVLFVLGWLLFVLWKYRKDRK